MPIKFKFASFVFRIDTSAYGIGKILLFLILVMERNPLLATIDIIQWPLLGMLTIFFIYELLLSKKVISDKFFWWISIFSIMCSFSLIWTYDSSRTVRDIFFLLKIIIILSFALYTIRREKSIEHIINYIIFATVINELVILPQVLGLGVGTYRQRIYVGGVYISANTIGPDIAFVTLLLFFRVMQSKCHQKINLVIILLNWLIILKLGSRSSLMVLVFGMLLNALNTSTAKKVRNLLAMAIAVILLGVVIINIPSLYNTIGNRIEDTLRFFESGKNLDSYNLQSDNLRYNLLRDGMEMFLEKPILGYGSGNFSSVNLLYNGDAHYAHNNYVELLVNMGIVGTFLFYLLHICILFSVKSRVNNKNLDKFGKELVLCMLLLDAMYVSYNVLNCILILLISYACCKIKLNTEKTDSLLMLSKG